MKEQNISVDIIIPVYNAYDYTKKCIETVIENTDLKQNTLVVINDKSPDEKILPMLREFEKKYVDLNICVLDNEENVGFVKTVNLGMSHSKNDVVLLNSDTEVTKNWLEKMKKVAYLKENVATVTPLSNNATLASVPNFLEENDIPNFVTLEEYAKEIEECSLEVFPEIPTAHGFCMYIKQEAIDKVGLFDDVTFGKGYGEENDFSYRCIQHGFVHLLCDNTFIHHKGTQSFTEAKKDLVEEHLKILQKKYPQNFEMTDKFCQTNPISYIQDNVKYAVNNQHRKNVLIVVHEFRKRESKLLGGTVLHIYDLIDALRGQMNFHVLYPENNQYKVTSFFENSTAELFLGKVNAYENTQIYNYEYKQLIQKVFDVINIDFVHVHHMMHHYYDIFDIIEKEQIPYMVSLHDFYFVCPTFALLENNEKYCGNQANCDCEKCLKKLKNIEGKFIENWRKLSYKILSQAKKLIAPSYSAKEIFEQYYPDLSIQVIEHGEEKLDKVYEAKSYLDKKNIAFIGGINHIKGVGFLKDFIQEVNKENSEFCLHLFGSTSEEDLNQSDGNYIFHGKYNREDIVKLLKENNIHIICLFSIWPETYSYTLTESLMAEIPVMALDYGAVSERIARDDLGWILDKDIDFAGIVQKLEEIFADETEYKKKVENIKKYLSSLKSTKEMAKEYEEIYTANWRQNEKKATPMDKAEKENMLKYSKYFFDQELEIMQCYSIIYNDNKRIEGYDQRIADYHHTVTEYRKEMDRLNQEIEKYKGIEENYNHLISSKKLNLLKKIKFIKF